MGSLNSSSGRTRLPRPHGGGRGGRASPAQTAGTGGWRCLTRSPTYPPEATRLVAAGAFQAGGDGLSDHAVVRATAVALARLGAVGAHRGERRSADREDQRADELEPESRDGLRLGVDEGLARVVEGADVVHLRQVA